MIGRNNPAEWHRWVEARLSDYLDQQLTPQEQARVAQHLGECVHCRASLESLRWTIALVKQAPAPVLRKSFTLPVPAPRPQPLFGFALARFAAAMATLALVAVLGIDVITHWSGAAPPLAAPMAQKSESTQAIALVPTLAPRPTETSHVSIVSESAPAAVPPVFPQPTKAPAPFPLTSRASSTSSARLNATPPARAPVVAGSGVITPTMVLPTATAVPPPTATLTATLAPTTTAIAQVQKRETTFTKTTAVTEPMFSPIRLIEIGLLFVVVFFGTLTILLRRRK